MNENAITDEHIAKWIKEFDVEEAEEPTILGDFQFTNFSTAKDPIDPQFDIPLGAGLTTLTGDNLVTAASYLTAASPQLNSSLNIHNNGELMLELDFESGDVTFGEAYSVDEASKAFWESMGKDSPDKLKKEIAELKTELAQFNQPKIGTKCKEVQRLDKPDLLDPNEDTWVGEDVAYFRKSLARAFSLGRLRNEKVKKQISLMEDCILPKQISGRGSLVETLPRTPEEKFNHAMNIMEK